jgi:hypothetical protein
MVTSFWRVRAVSGRDVRLDISEQLVAGFARRDVAAAAPHRFHRPRFSAAVCRVIVHLRHLPALRTIDACS